VIDKSLDASGVAQGMRDARRSPYQALRRRQQPKSTNGSIEVKITGHLHVANPKRDEVLVRREVFSPFRPTTIRAGDRLVDQAPETIEPEETSQA
jgi:hypothetical protein